MEAKEILSKIENSGFKKKWLAEKCGVSDVLFSYYINGTRQMPEKVKKELFKYIT